MRGFEKQLSSLDLDLFARIPAQLTDADKRSLMAVQNAVRKRLPSYVYLEIGSHLGGSIQPHIRDPRCKRIFSIDRRPAAQADDRGYTYYYPENSTAYMLQQLRAMVPDAETRITCFDTDASAVATASISPAPQMCLIDGEHTDRAASADYAFCRKVIANTGVILFHDANVIYTALARIVEDLQKSGTPFHAYALPTSIFVVELGGADVHRSPAIRTMLIDNHEQYLYGLLSLEHYREVYNRKPVRLLRSMWQAWLRLKRLVRYPR